MSRFDRPGDLRLYYFVTSSVIYDINPESKRLGGSGATWKPIRRDWP
jgi:hypothetical protein